MASESKIKGSILDHYSFFRIEISSNGLSRNEEPSRVEVFLLTFSRIFHSCYTGRSLITFQAEKIMQEVLQERTCSGPWVDLDPESSRSSHFNECSQYT